MKRLHALYDSCLLGLLGLILLASGCNTVKLDGKVSGQERALLEEWAKQGMPAPTATPSPAPVESEFPDGLTWLHSDVSGWAVTSNLTATVTPSRVHLDYDKASVWPACDEAGASVNANPWVVAEVDGKWYAGTWEWLRFGQTVKNNVVRGDHVKRSPLSGDWQPQSGDRVGIFVSGLIRGQTRNVNERTNLVWVTWP